LDANQAVGFFLPFDNILSPVLNKKTVANDTGSFFWGINLRPIFIGKVFIKVSP